MTAEKAYLEMGKKAFHKGIVCSPAADPALMKSLKGKPGENIKNLKAWVKGWTIENLKPGSVWKARK